MPSAPEAPKLFTITTPQGLFTPTRVPQGVLNATAYFQRVMTDLLHGLDCKVWVDHVFYFVDSEELDRRAHRWRAQLLGISVASVGTDSYRACPVCCSVQPM
ncbi:unnamed protein product [Hapterophycus canaliculatus]